MLDADGLSLANKLSQKRVAKDCADWIQRKVDIRTIRQSNLLHGKMYHVANGDVEDAIFGSSNFTVRGLGLGNGDNNIELNLIVDSNRDRQDLEQWFKEVWDDEKLVTDVKEDVLLYLRKLYANQSPQFIYYLTLFHLFRDYLDGKRDLDDSLRRVALPDTRIWRTLFSFQKDGAKAAINKILDYNGCILADSVGLGKTYTALAVIKYFELRNERVLVLCPKKLTRNWTIYRNPSTLNPFSDDKFRYDVLHHTDLSRDSGEVNGIHLDSLNWGAYDLVVIDESHNFRNNKLATQRPGEPEKRSRYQRLMEDIISAGVRTKVLLLPSHIPFPGNWDTFIKALYIVFERDFKDRRNSPGFQSRPVWHKNWIEADDPYQFEEGFWHLVTRDQWVENRKTRRREKERLPEFDRAGRLPWARPIIDYCTNIEVRVWDFDDETSKGKVVRTYLWLKNHDYVVILERQKKNKGDVFMLITSFYLDYEGKRLDLQSRYDRRRK